MALAFLWLWGSHFAAQKILAFCCNSRYIESVVQMQKSAFVRVSPPPSSFGVDLRGIANVIPRFFWREGVRRWMLTGLLAGMYTPMPHIDGGIAKYLT